MRTIIAGSRSITDIQYIRDAIEFSGFEITKVISGAAKGVDYLGELWAAENNIFTELYPAQWERYGRGAGFKRNALMATKADALIAVWDGKSSGTHHMIQMANNLGLKVFIYKVDL